MDHSTADTTALLGRVSAMYKKPLRQLPSGVMTAGYDDAEVERFIRSFGTEKGAEDYTARHANIQLLQRISRLLGASGVRPREDATILDVGTGSGNTILPIFELFPRSFVVASDLSLHFLAILLNRIRSDRLCAIQESAEDLNFRSGSFDYVLGNAVLHHLFHPAEALARVADVLKPGGAALFFEPCENGKVLSKLAVERVIQHDGFETLEEPLRRWAQRFVKNIELRWKYRANERPDLYQNKDDKWVFTRSFFHQPALAGRFSKVFVEATDKSSRAVSNNIKSNLKQHKIVAPDWVTALIEDFEDQFSPEFLKDNPQALSIALVR